MSFLILSSSTGGGHDARARSLTQWLEAEYPGATVHTEQILEDSSSLLAFGVHFYNFIHRRAPVLHNVYWYVAEFFMRSHGKRVQWGGRYYREMLRAYRPQVIISVHDSTNRGYFEDARNVLGADAVRCVTYCGEWTGGFGFSLNWLNASGDRYYARTSEALEYAVQQGIPAPRGRLCQRLLPPGAFRLPEPQTADYDALRESIRRELGLQKDGFTLFLAAGAQGPNNHLAILRSLEPLADWLQLIVVCGRHAEVHRAIRGWHSAHPAIKLHLEGFSERMGELLLASDAVVMRGGANTTTEALHHGCLPVFNRLGGIMPQERLTVRYFRERQACEEMFQLKDLANCLQRWRKQPERYAACLRRFLSLRRADTPREMVQELGALAREVS